jgi:vesicular inhibitory amino acid transporter
MEGLQNDSEVELYTSDHVPIQITSRSRRGSVFDAGGVSSINNFASSVQRSVNYLSTSFDSKHALSPILQSMDDTLAESEVDTIIVSEEISDNQNYGSINNNIVNEIDIRVIKSNDTEAAEIIKIISLKSTPVQTVFNSINVLIGLGILSIPLALHLSGWILGILCISFAAFSTKQTAVLLGKILHRHPQLKTYQDIGVYCFGEIIGFIILIIFTLDLFGAGISMILLFADSFYALSPDTFSKFSLKLSITAVLVILNFLPLRLLSFLSLTGIICTTVTCGIIGLSGIIKKESPGSLLNPMDTNMYPKSLLDFFFALGLYMAPWGGHATFPEIYRDQLRPTSYELCMNHSFSFSYVIDLTTGVLGFLMFGRLVDDEITKNILITKGYPKWISTIIVTLMGLLPISKLPLISRPIITILDSKLGDNRLQRLFNRALLSLLFLVASTLLTNFGKVMSLLGSLICFTVCLTLPCLYYISVFKKELSNAEIVIWSSLVVIGTIGAIGGTIAVGLK